MKPLQCLIRSYKDRGRVRTSTELAFSMNIQAPPPDAAREIDKPYDITPEQIAQFEQRGFIKLSNVLSPQTVAYFKDALDPLMHHRAQELPPLAERDIYGQSFVAYDNLWLR